MATLRLRWSEHEARKPYARPFMVSFVDDDGDDLGSIALNGADLLYWRQFGGAVAALSGELFVLDAVESRCRPSARLAGDPRAAAARRPTRCASRPRSTFDHERGRIFGFVVSGAGDADAVVDGPTLLEYQDFQAALVHQTGRLLRVDAVEQHDDAGPRRRAWITWLRDVVERPGDDDAMTAEWPWR